MINIGRPQTVATPIKAIPQETGNWGGPEVNSPRTNTHSTFVYCGAWGKINKIFRADWSKIPKKGRNL